MSFGPKTKAEALSYRYGAWAGFPQGHKYDPTKCAELVSDHGRFAHFYQCTRANGHGPEGLFCKIHDPGYIEEKRKKQDAKYEAKNRYERPKWHAHAMMKLLIESQSSVDDDWRGRRDKLLKFLQE